MVCVNHILNAAMEFWVSNFGMSSIFMSLSFGQN